MRLHETITEGKETDPYVITKNIYDKAFPFVKEYLKHFRSVHTDPLFWSGRDGNVVYSERKIRTDRAPKDTPEYIHNEFDAMLYKRFRKNYRSNSIFVVGNPGEAGNYGDSVYAIFPIGSNYSHIYNPDVSDLFSLVVDSGDYNYSFFGKDISDIAYELADSGDGYEIEEEVSYRIRASFEEEHEHEFEEWEEEDIDVEEEYDKYHEEHADGIYQEVIDEKSREIYEETQDAVERLFNGYKENQLRGALSSWNEIMLSGKSYIMVRSDYVPFVQRYMEVMGSKKPTKERWVDAIKGINLIKYINVRGKTPVRHNKYVNNDLLDMLDAPE